MKRFLFFFLAMTLAMGGTAFGAEQETNLYVDSGKKELQHPLLRQAEKTLIAAEDLANSIGGSLIESEDGKNLILRDKAWEKADTPVWMERKNEVWITFQPETTAWTGMVHGKRDAAGTVYIPLRDAASALLYETKWSRQEKGEAIWLYRPTMPRLSAEAVYDERKNAVTATLYNAEPQEFMYGCDYFLQKWNGTEWKEIDMGTGRTIDDTGFSLSGDWKKDGTVGERQVTFYGNELTKGKYRICIPIDTVFHFGEFMPSDYVLKEDEESQYWWWKTYYEFEEGRPTFTLPPNISGRVLLKYVVTGEFEVK